MLKVFTSFSILVSILLLFFISAMNHSISISPQDVLRPESISDELIAAAIAGVIQGARSNGQSLEDLMREVLADDALLNGQQRRFLGEVVATAWETLPNTLAVYD